MITASLPYIRSSNQYLTYNKTISGQISILECIVTSLKYSDPRLQKPAKTELSLRKPPISYKYSPSHYVQYPNCERTDLSISISPVASPCKNCEILDKEEAKNGTVKVYASSEGQAGVYVFRVIAKFDWPVYFDRG
jgi:hypothetical protein